jgi:SARP family transcriptional regulator, regulator of embCAB operon
MHRVWNDFAMEAVEIRVLGPLEIGYGDAVIPVPGRKQRAVLAALAAASGRIVALDVLVHSVWGEESPDGAEHSLQQHVSSLRKLIAAAGHPDAAAVLQRRDPGYLLVNASIDSERFEKDATAGFHASRDHRWKEACVLFVAALAQWRGDAFADARESLRLTATATRLDSMRLTVKEARFDALLASGQANHIVGELEAAIADHRFHEPFRRQLMLALYRSGRQADALAAYQSARRILVDELGIEPNADLQALEADILRQRVDLDNPSKSEPIDLFETFRAGATGQPARLEFDDGQSVFLVNGTNLVGRDPAARVRLLDGRVSRRHAELVCSGATCRVRDLRSTNGTFVNGQPVDDHALVDHDTIDFGGVEVRFRVALAFADES